MQTLVYENYNKFIAATDTIRKMRVDFRAMEDEMDQLASKMTNIAAFSSQISDTLGEKTPLENVVICLIKDFLKVIEGQGLANSPERTPC